MKRLFASIALCFAARLAAQSPNVTAAFVTVQGNDTISLERYSRAGNVITGTWVSHLHGTQVHDYVLTLGANGLPAHYEMTLTTPGVLVPPNALRSVTITYGSDSATYVTVTNTTLTQRVSMKDAYPLLGKSVVGLELALVRLRSAHTDSANITLNLPTGPDPLHTPITAAVRFYGADSVIIAGNLGARLDKDGRLLVVHSGSAETRRVGSLDIAKVVAGFVAADAPRLAAEAAALAARVAITLPAAALQRFVGEYSLVANGVVKIQIAIERRGDSLFMRVGDRPPTQLFAQSASVFFVKAQDAQIEFEGDASGNVAALVIAGNGTRQRAPKAN